MAPVSIQPVIGLYFESLSLTCVLMLVSIIMHEHMVSITYTHAHTHTHMHTLTHDAHTYICALAIRKHRKGLLHQFCTSHMLSGN